jgi:hypothetical protein
VKDKLEKMEMSIFGVLNGLTMMYELCRASQEERSIFWEVTVKNCMYMCPLLTGFQDSVFHCTVPKLMIRKRYYILFLIPVFIVPVTQLVQFT